MLKYLKDLFINPYAQMPDKPTLFDSTMKKAKQVEEQIRNHYRNHPWAHDAGIIAERHGTSVGHVHDIRNNLFHPNGLNEWEKSVASSKDVPPEWYTKNKKNPILKKKTEGNLICENY